MEYQSIIDKYYPEETPLREVFIKHSRQVADKAIKICIAKNLDLSLEEVEIAAMLHDIGIFMTDAPTIHCNGQHPYITHGILGAELLRKNGIDEKYARVAERHTGSGITIEDIKTQNMPLPLQDYCPETLLEKLICYADKFFSKSGDMKEKNIDLVMKSMAKHSQETLNRFKSLHNLFQ